MAAGERPTGEVVQHLHLVLGVDGHVAVVGQFRRHGQLAGRHAFGQAEADGHRAEVAAADGLGVPAATISWPKSTATRSASASTSSM